MLYFTDLRQITHATRQEAQEQSNEDEVVQDDSEAAKSSEPFHQIIAPPVTLRWGNPSVGMQHQVLTLPVRDDNAASCLKALINDCVGASFGVAGKDVYDLRLTAKLAKWTRSIFLPTSALTV